MAYLLNYRELVMAFIRTEIKRLDALPDCVFRENAVYRDGRLNALEQLKDHIEETEKKLVEG